MNPGAIIRTQGASFPGSVIKSSRWSFRIASSDCRAHSAAVIICPEPTSSGAADPRPSAFETSRIPVATAPGQMRVTLTPLGSSSARSESKKPCTACLLAQ